MLLHEELGFSFYLVVIFEYFLIFLKLIFGMTYIHQVVKFKNIDLKQNLFYISSLTLFHHLVLFFIEVFDSSKLILVFEKAIFTSIFTILLIVLLNLFLKNK